MWPEWLIYRIARLAMCKAHVVRLFASGRLVSGWAAEQIARVKKAYSEGRG